MKHVRSAILLTMVSLQTQGQTSGSAASASSDPLGPGEVAVVGGERIAESVYRLFTLNSLQTPADNLPPDVRRQVIDRLIMLELLSQEAEKRGLHQERRIAAELALQRLQILARHMSERYAEQNPPSESELRELYEASLPQLQITEYKTRHILVDSEAEAREVLEELDDGESFPDMAQQYSTDTSAANGGDLGWLTANAIAEPLSAAIQAATPGVPVQTPVQSAFGWHVLLVEETRTGEPPRFEEVRQDLVTAVNARKLTALLEELRQQAGVEIVE